MISQPTAWPENLRAFGLINEDQYPAQPELNTEFPARDQIDNAKTWLSEYAEPRASLTLRPTSYGFKHLVKRWAGRYISNGAFIAAAIELGYKWRRVMNGPNAIFALRMKVNGTRKRGRQPSWETFE
jgi:hypothetical protein